MKVLRIIFVIAFLISFLKNNLYQLYWWQLKEYRWDRFWIHLKTKQGKKLFLSEKEIIKWLLLFSASFLNNSFWFFLTILGLFTLEALFFLKQLLTSDWKKPDFTLKTVFIIVLAFLICFGVIFNSGFTPAKFLIFDRALLLVIGALVVLTNVPVKIYQQILIQRAKQKIKDHQDLLVIGITGSYGKSSTKEFLTQILASKFKVLKTPANFNTAIGIAQTILENLEKNHQFFVCEMGAYKKGEIKMLCEIVKPKVGIITGLDHQHLALFGSLENTMQAKFELIEALPEKGLAVFNGYDQNCLKMAEKAEKMGRKVKVAKKETKNFKINLIGKHFLQNVQMAKIAAEELGIQPQETEQLVKKLDLPPQTMEIIEKKDLTLINSTYNSNPHGVLAALDLLKTKKGPKTFVFQPIIELGKASSQIHEKIGKKAGQICDRIILTNENNYQDILRGAKGKVLLKKGISDVKKGVILFEGKGARKFLKSLIPNY